MIKYRYALDRFNNLIDIQKLERINLLKEDKFFSVDFIQPLIPRLGKIKKKHFAHKSIQVVLGNIETYLHALGKKIFLNEYNECLDSRTPFYLSYSIKNECTRLKEKFNISCSLKDQIFKYDLTKYFTEILIEKKDGNYIPDLLLLNPLTNEKIYVEIAVTHYSSQEKIKSGNRIIEFNITNEDDLNEIFEFKKGNSSDKTQYFNFKQKKNSGSFCSPGKCCTKFNFFNVSGDGRCNLKIITEPEIGYITRKYDSTSIWTIIEPSIHKSDDDDYYRGRKKSQTFKDYLIKANKEKIKVKNCYICRYHAENTSWDYVEGEPIFCKFQKITCNSNYASKCRFFKVDSVFD